MLESDLFFPYSQTKSVCEIIEVFSFDALRKFSVLNDRLLIMGEILIVRIIFIFMAI